MSAKELVTSIKKLNRYLKRYRVSILLGALFLTASNFFLFWIPVLIRNTMDEMELLGEQQHGLYTSVFELLTSSAAGRILAYYPLLLIRTVLLYGVLFFATRQTLIVRSRKREFAPRH